MRIQRHVPRRRSSLPLVPCGCLAALTVTLLIGALAVLLLAPALPGLLAQLAGFAPSGDTDSALDQAVLPPLPPLQNAVQPPDAVLNLGQYGTQPLSVSRPNEYSVAVGEAVGQPAAEVSFTEAGLLELCRQRTNVCGDDHPQVRAARVDLRPGGAILYAEVSVPQLGGFWQPVGVVLRLTPDARGFEFAGLDINGTLYDTPPGNLAAVAADVQQRGSELLRTLVLQAQGERFTLDRVRIDDATITLFLRA